MGNFETFLLNVFNYLRRNGVPLGISEYLLALQTIRECIGVEDLEQLRRVCRLLWAKSKEDQEICDVAFTKFFESQVQPAKPSDELNIPIDNYPQIPFAADTQEANQTVKGSETFGQSQELPSFYPMTVDDSSILPTYAPYQQKTYHLIPRLPFGKREMAGSWRQLRKLKREGREEELDVNGTIQTISQTGVFLGPKFQPRRQNQARLVLLIDQQGSMLPFSLLIEALIESVVRGGLLGRVELYYFHDCPQNVLYEKPTLTRAHPVEDLLAEKVKKSSVLLVSDAGAARGDYDQQRVEDTKKFLEKLHQCTYLYAWINPLSPSRWKGTTAEDIACFVPMYSLNRDGLNDAINILRGHPFPPGVNINA